MYNLIKWLTNVPVNYIHLKLNATDNYARQVKKKGENQKISSSPPSEIFVIAIESQQLLWQSYLS